MRLHFLGDSLLDRHLSGIGFLDPSQLHLSPELEFLGFNAASKRKLLVLKLAALVSADSDSTAGTVGAAYRTRRLVLLLPAISACGEVFPIEVVFG